VKKTLQLLIVAGALATAPLALAQDGPAKGAKTVQLNGLYDNFGGFRSWNLNIGGSMFFSDVLEGAAGIAYSEARDGGVSSKATAISLGANYYFNTNMAQVQAWHPYVGARYARYNFSGGGMDGNADSWAGAVGAHYFLREGVSLNPEFRFGRVKGGGVSENQTSFGIGLTIWLN
jgi:hypothetical protein